MKFINSGRLPNDGTGDTIREAVEKINDNFSFIYEKLRLERPFLIIVWEKLSDSIKAMEDVNYNFRIVKKHLS